MCFQALISETLVSFPVFNISKVVDNPFQRYTKTLLLGSVIYFFTANREVNGHSENISSQQGIASADYTSLMFHT